MTLHVLVVDDEPTARAGLAGMLRDETDVAQISESAGCDEAIRLIRELRPDLVLLDVQLNPGTGFDVITNVEPANMPGVIFVTAFDEFAVAAFDAAALDYVLKPVDPVRLRTALARARRRRAESDLHDAAARLANAAERLTPKPSRPVVVQDVNRTLVFEPAEITRIEAEDYYARLHARGRSWLIREALDSLEQRLPTPPFFRVHRSAIINAAFVTAVTRVSRHRHELTLRDGSRVPLSEARREAFSAWLAPQHDTRV